MKIDLKKVRELREKTGASLMMIKNALISSQDDVNAAQKWLNEHWKPSEIKIGFSKIFSHVHQGRIGVMVELSCGTDFVANTEEFNKLGHELTLQLVAGSPEEHIEDQHWIRDPNRLVMDLIDDVSKKTGETIRVAKTIRWEV